MSAERMGFSTRSKMIGTAILAGAVSLSAFVAYKASQNDNEPGSTPIPGGIVEPSNTPIPTPFSTEHPTVTLPPSSTPPPEVTPSSEITPRPTPEPTQNLSELEQNLQNWENGTIKIPENKLFKLADNRPARVNIIDTEKSKGINSNTGEWVPSFQGYLLGIDMVDNHVIAYVGQQDKNGNNYFIPLAVGGKLGKDYTGVLYKDKQRYVSPTGQADSKVMPLEEIKNIMISKLENDTIVFSLFPFQYPDNPLYNFPFKEFNAQAETARQFSEWSIVVAGGKSYKDASLLKKYPLVKSLINQKISHFKLGQLPYAHQWWVPRNDVY